MYRFLDTPRPTSDLGGWQVAVGEFTQVVGYMLFGDFFLRDPDSGRYAVLTVMSPRVRALKYTDRQSLENIFLSRESVIEHLLRPADVLALKQRLGEPGPADVFIPAVCPHVTEGTPDLSTYHTGDVWAFAARVAASHGIGEGGAVDALPLRLQRDDDFELWRVALGHILSELPKTPEVLVQIGRCSHWLRPHQTRWTADGGFAWPVGYGSGTGGYSFIALPQFDWSVVLAWTGHRWEVARKNPSSLFCA